MHYTFKRFAGIACILLALMVLARFIPSFLWITIIVLLCAAIAYLLYNSYC